MRARLAKAALLGASLLFAFAVGEAALRFVFHTAPQLDLDIYRQEDGLLLLRPNVERRHVTRYWDVEVRTNSEGWRDDERSDAAVTLLGLGDSFAFGWGVELEESFFHRAEGVWESEELQIVEAGVPGSSTIDQERLLEELIPRYRPNAVVLALFVGNDFTETGLGGAERLRVVDGLLELEPLEGEAESRWRGLARKSHLLQLLRAVQFRFGDGAGPSRTWDAWMRKFAQIHLRKPSVEAEMAIAETLASLDRMAARCAEDGVELIVAVLPRSFQVDAAEREEMRLALGVGPEDLDLDKPQRVLREWSQRTGVPVMDPLEDFRAAAAGGARLYYSPDAHMTAAGHEAIAVRLAEELRRLEGVR